MTKPEVIAFPPTEDIYQYGLLVSAALKSVDRREPPTWAEYWKMKADGLIPTSSSKEG